jgi:hypothetical protein
METPHHQSICNFLFHHTAFCACAGRTFNTSKLPLPLPILLRHHGRSNPPKKHATAADLHRRKRGTKSTTICCRQTEKTTTTTTTTKLFRASGDENPRKKEEAGGRKVPAGYTTHPGVKITAGPIWAFKSHLNHRPGISNPKVPNRTEPSDWEIEW